MHTDKREQVIQEETRTRTHTQGGGFFVVRTRFQARPQDPLLLQAPRQCLSVDLPHCGCKV